MPNASFRDRLRRAAGIVARVSLCFGVVLGLANHVCRADDAAEVRRVSRRVLGLYNSHDGLTADMSRIHKHLAMALNHLGFAVDYADIDAELPDFTPYRGIIVWPESNRVDQPGKLVPWLIRAMDAGVKIIMPEGLEDPVGPNGRPPPFGMLDEFWARFGLRPTGQVFSGKDELFETNHFPERFAYETDREVLVGEIRVMRTAGNAMRPWQTAARKDDPDNFGVLLAVGEHGAWAANERVLYFTFEVEGEPYRLAWNVDPFAFFTEALRCAEDPKPDVTTFWGSRGAYAHVDVDGPYNVSQDWPGPPRYALEIAHEGIWQRYPYPVTLGFITCEYDPELDVRFLQVDETVEEALAKPRPPWLPKHAEVAEAMRKIARKSLALPHVQAGCHGFSHPLIWSEKRSGYAIAGYEFSFEQEVFGAVDYLNKNLLPPGKQVELFQWSGECDPPEEALAVLARMGMSNINGGDPRYDGKFSSVYYICPLTRPAGKYLQVHTSGSNENIYTLGWTGFKGAFNNVITTFEKSDFPRRFLPVNIYYHVFPVEMQAGLLAIQHAYEWAEEQDLCWMRALEYVKAVESFDSVKIGKLADGGWRIDEYGNCATVRFDDETRVVDVEASRNVAGWTRHAGSLYVALLPGESAEVRLAPSPAATPALARSSGMLRDVRAEPAAWSAKLCAWGPGFIEIWGGGGGKWRGTAVLPDGQTIEPKIYALGDGRARMDLPGAEGQWIAVNFFR